MKALSPSLIKLYIPVPTTATKAMNSMMNKMISIMLYLLVFYTILSIMLVTNTDPKKAQIKNVPNL